MARIFNEGFEFGNKGQFYRAVETGYATAPYAARMPGGRAAVFGKSGSLTARLEPLSEFYTRFLYFPNTWDSGHYYGRRLTIVDTYGKAVAQVSWGYRDQPNAQVGIGLQVGTSPTLAASSPDLLGEHEYRAVIEVHYRYTLDDSSAANPNFEMRVNGATVLTYAGPTAIAPTIPPEKPIEYEIRDIIYSAPPARWGGLDDVAINDTSGSVDNSWCGDGVIALLKPNGKVITQLTPSDPAKPNFQLVSDLNAATYVEGIAPGLHDIYTVAVPTLKPNDTVERVWAQANARMLNIDSRGIALGIDGGAGMEWSEGLKVGLDLTGVRGKQFPSNGGKAWTPATLATLQIGVKVE